MMGGDDNDYHYHDTPMTVVPLYIVRTQSASQERKTIMHTQTLDEILSLPTVSSGEVVITKKYGLLDDPVEIQKQRDAGPKPNQLWLARNLNDDNDDIDDMIATVDL